MKSCAIIPAYNEARRLTPVVRATLAHVDAVLVVDDGSSDDTSAAGRAAGAAVVRLEPNRGKGAALETGFQWARAQGCEICITLDADGQHDPADIPALLAAHASGAPAVVVGSRMSDVKAMPPLRKCTNWFMSWMLSRLMGQWVPDTQCGYRLFRCDALADLRVESPRFAAESEILLELARRGHRIASAPVRTIYGDEKSKIHPVRDTIRFFSMVSRFRRKMRRTGG
jgi:glycosyltransferase involved in cell wall biosynthesis